MKHVDHAIPYAAGYYYQGVQKILPKTYVCGYCSNNVCSDAGYQIAKHTDGSGNSLGGIYLCTSCNSPTYFSANYLTQFPTAPFGRSIDHLPNDVGTLYDEARRCTGSNCFTAAVLLCRKLLMHIAVDKGADAGLSFVAYVDHLSDNNFVPPGGRDWVDKIRTKGNEANHEIIVMTSSDVEDLLTFTEMLLRMVYEFPGKLAPSTGDEPDGDTTGLARLLSDT